MDEWSKMNEELVSWSHEIIDNDIKVEYIVFCRDKIFKKMDILDDVSKSKYDDILNEVISKYINHIPSLKQRVRDSKLNEILK